MFLVGDHYLLYSHLTSKQALRMGYSEICFRMVRGQKLGGGPPSFWPRAIWKQISKATKLVLWLKKSPAAHPASHSASSVYPSLCIGGNHTVSSSICN